jgi:hypothetical protein
MSAFDPAALLTTAEGAGAHVHLLIYDDGSRYWQVTTIAVDWQKMPKFGALTDEQLNAMMDEIWWQRRPDRIHYAGPRGKAP